ncbi:MAG: SPOR domain-containing protein, partial [Ruthenibacterium sp.]
TFIAKVSGFVAALQAPNTTQDGTLYTVQTGAFARKQNAENYVKTLREKGVEAFITPKEG